MSEPIYARSLDKMVYFSQRNNYGSPYNECFPTSMTMMMANNMGDNPADITLRAFMEDDLFDHYIEKTFRRQSAKYEWANEEKMANEWIGKSPYIKSDPKPVKWMENADELYIQREIDKGRMVVCGTDKLGGLPGGHIVCIGGYDEFNWYLWDPFGNWSTNYKDHDGKNVKIDKKHKGIYKIRGLKAYRIMVCRIEAC